MRDRFPLREGLFRPSRALARPSDRVLRPMRGRHAPCRRFRSSFTRHLYPSASLCDSRVGVLRRSRAPELSHRRRTQQPIARLIPQPRRRCVAAARRAGRAVARARDFGGRRWLRLAGLCGPTQSCLTAGRESDARRDKGARKVVSLENVTGTIGVADRIQRRTRMTPEARTTTIRRPRSSAGLITLGPVWFAMALATSTLLWAADPDQHSTST